MIIIIIVDIIISVVIICDVLFLYYAIAYEQ